MFLNFQIDTCFEDSLRLYNKYRLGTRQNSQGKVNGSLQIRT